MKRNLVAGALSLNLILFLSHPSQADEGVQIRALTAASAQREHQDRLVDQAALSAQDSSINRLNVLLKKYTGNGRQEPILLSKLAELQQQKAAILFRIAHGVANKKGGKLDLASYNKSLQQTISTLNHLIGRYPGYSDIASAYFMRGKSYEEMENKPAATKDYLYLVKTFPDSEQTSPAYMSLAEFAIEANNHPQAIVYLKELEKRPEDPHYPFALYKLAWSYYNLKDVPHALSYAEKQVAYYNAKYPPTPGDQSKDKGADNLINSDLALKENTLLDIPLFYFQGVEEKNEHFKTSAALDYFRKVEKGPILGKMAYRFAKLMRSRNMEKDLIAWKNQFLDSEATRPETLDIIIITYEYLQNQRNFAAVVETAKDMLTLYKKVGKEPFLKHEQLPKAQKMILDTAENLQSVIVKNKQSEKARDLSVTLASLYDIFTQVVVESDPRIPQVHYNLAETLFTIEDYEGATLHYRWVVEHSKSLHKAVVKSVSDSPIKAIASRYEVLRQKKQIPTEVKAVALSKDAGKGSGRDMSKLDPILKTWIEWIDQLGDQLASEQRHQKKGEPEIEQYKTWDNFNFEANRAIYVFGDQKLAVERLEEFAKKRPHSTYGIPSASLVLDTFIAGSDWDASYERATAFRKLDPWKKSDFGKRLYEVAADALYKKIEIKVHAKLYKDALEEADDFIADYPESSRIPDCLSLAGSAALANNEKPRAMGYFSKLIQSDKDPTRVSNALLSRAALQEEKFEFASAVTDYRAYINLVHSGAFKDAKQKPDTSKVHDFRKKTLALAWLAANNSELKSLIESKAICIEGNDSIEAECEKYRAISAIQQSATHPLDEDTTTNTFNRFRKMDSSEAKTLWAIYTLQGAKHLAFRDRNHTLRAIGSGWKDLDAMSKFFVLPYINGSIVKAFELNRAAMKDVAPLRANEKYITHRVDSIRELENAVAKVMDLPWARIRAETLNQLASVYQDLAKGLSDLPPPKGLNEAETAGYQDTIRKLTLPFEEKANDIRSKAFDMASRFTIESDSFNSIVEPFFAENPSQAKKLKSLTEESRAGVVIPKGIKAVSLGMDLLPTIKEAHELAVEAAAQKEKAAGRKPADDSHAKLILEAWTHAIKNRNWVQVAFFLQEAKDRKVFTDSEMGLIRTVSLASAGAKGEALVELEETRKIVDPKLEPVVALTLAMQYEYAFAPSRAKAIYTAFVPPAPPAPAVASSSKTSSSSVPGKSSDRKPASQN
jgi:TolA-binding protein